MRVLITGGHFSPALALIEALPRESQVAVVGRKHTFEGDSALSYEYQVCEARNIPFFPIRAGRFQRTFTRYTIPSLVRLPIGFFDALNILNTWKPDIIVTFGGYLAVPVALAARFKNIPVVVHEQTMEAGLANKIIAKWAAKVCISFPSSRHFFPKEKIVITGNPIRRDVFKIGEKIDIPEKKEMIYITGGSSGSHSINLIIEALLPELLQNFIVIHQVGDSTLYPDFGRLEKKRESLSSDLKSHYILRKFIQSSEIGYILNRADLVISRSGINTVSELMALHKPCLFIPLPTGQKNEQLKNAQYAVRLGIGEYILQDDATPEKVYDLILKMIRNKKEYSASYKDTNTVEDADARVVNVIQSVYEMETAPSKKAKISSAG